MAERWAADNAELILGSTPESAQDIIGFYDSAGLDIPILLPENSHVSLSLIEETLGYDLSVFRNAVALLRETDDATAYQENLAGVADCVDRFQEATGEVVNGRSSQRRQSHSSTRSRLRPAQTSTWNA